MRKQAYSILVYNNPGLLSRMAGLFSRRGYNIESITAGTTADPRFTRITIVVEMNRFFHRSRSRFARWKM